MLLLVTLTTTGYLWCALSALAGMAVYLFVVKIPSALERARVANVPMTLWQYFQHDMVAIVGSLASIVLALIVADELLQLRPGLVSIIKILYGFIGFTNSSLIIALLGRFGKYINTIVDYKTDKADGKISTEPTQPL